MPDPFSRLARIKLWWGFFTRISYPRDLRLAREAMRKRRNLPIAAETWSIVESVGGFLSRKEAGFLHWAASAWPLAGPVIELGSYEGRSTIVFTRAGRQVHAIDAWSLDVSDLSAYGNGVASADHVFERFQRAIQRAQVDRHIRIHRGLTHDVGRQWNLSAAILFIDAGHTYADVKDDLETWTPHLAPRGLLIMHDVLGDVYLGVTRAASELLRQGWRVEASAGSIVAFTRETARP